AVGAQKPPGRRVNLHDSDARHIEDRAKQLFARVQSLFRLLTLGDVERDADDARGLATAALAGKQCLAPGQRPAEAPVRTHRAELDLELAVAARIERGFGHLQRFFVLVGMNKLDQFTLRAAVLVRQAEDPSHFRRPVTLAGLQIGAIQAEAGRLRRQAQARFALAHYRFGHFQIVNVSEGSKPFDDPPLIVIRHGAIPAIGGAILSGRPSRRGAAPLVSIGDAAPDKPAVGLVRATQPEFEVNRLAHPQPFLPYLLHVFAVIRMNERPPLLIQRFVGGRAGVAVPSLIEIIHAAIRPRGPNQLRDGFGQRGVTALAFAQRVFKAFAVGNVFGDSHNVAALSRLVIHREAAVLHPDRRAVGSHDAIRLVVTALHDLREIFLLDALAVFWVNRINPPLERRGGGASPEPLVSRADVDRGARLRIRDPKDIGDVLDQFAETFLALAQRDFRMFALGHVEVDSPEADRPTALVAVDADEIEDPSLFRLSPMPCPAPRKNNAKLLPHFVLLGTEQSVVAVHHTLEIVGMNASGPQLIGRLIGLGKIVEFPILLAPVRSIGIELDLPHAGLRALEGQPQPLFTLAQPLFGALAIGGVNHQPTHSHGLSRFVVGGVADVGHPLDTAVRPEDAVFDVEVAPLGQRLRDIGLDPVNVFKVHTGAPGLILLFDLFGPAERAGAIRRPENDAGDDVKVE